MIQEGHVRVVWLNSNDTIASPRYTVTFASYEPFEEFDAQKSKAIVGEAELMRFLYDINIDADDLKTGSFVLQDSSVWPAFKSKLKGFVAHRSLSLVSAWLVARRAHSPVAVLVNPNYGVFG